MIRPLTSLVALTLGSLLAITACASSEDDAPGGGGIGGFGGAAGGGGAAGSASGGGGSGGTTSGGGTGGGTTDGGGGVGGTTVSDAGPPTTVTGSLVDIQDPTKPVQGVQVCLYENSSVPCVMTDSTGHYTLTGVPSDSEVLIEFTKSDYFPTLLTLTTTQSPSDLGELLAPSKAAVGLLALAVGTVVDPAKGQVLFMSFKPNPNGTGLVGEADVVGALNPKSGVGPYYLDANQLPDKTLVSTSTTGVGLFANVDAGYYELTMSHFSKSCQTMSTAWAGSAATAAKLRVVAGYLTGGAAIQCPP